MQIVIHTLLKNFKNQIINYLLRSLHFGMPLIIGSVFSMFNLDTYDNFHQCVLKEQWKTEEIWFNYVTNQTCLVYSYSLNIFLWNIWIRFLRPSAWYSTWGRTWGPIATLIHEKIYPAPTGTAPTELSLFSCPDRSRCIFF